MKNVYHRDIMEILIANGSEGVRLCRIARKIYNKHADFFNQEIDYDTIHKTIGSYLWKQSKRKETPFRRISYGIYALKTDMAIQMDLFWDVAPLQEHKEEKAVQHEDAKHLQLTLF